MVLGFTMLRFFSHSADVHCPRQDGGGRSSINRLDARKREVAVSTKLTQGAVCRDKGMAVHLASCVRAVCDLKTLLLLVNLQKSVLRRLATWVCVV